MIDLASGIQSISAGYYATCALTTGGGVKCWGSNEKGQLGNGTIDFNPHPFPLDVPGLTSGVKAVAVGGTHACVLTLEGGVKCWGFNDKGQLGNGTTDTDFTPTSVNGLTGGVRAITAGHEHTCALTVAGSVKCWGYNIARELGDGTNEIWRTTPVQVLDLTSGVETISAGSQQTCAVSTAGGVTCWGGLHVVPADISGLNSGIQAVTGGSGHVCALTTTGGVKCWQDNSNGQLGIGTAVFSWWDATPVDVSGLTSGVKAISAGGERTCAVTTGGGVKCWGGGALGNGAPNYRMLPVESFGFTSGVQAIAVGDRHSCALTAAGDAKCWGPNEQGQLGNGTQAGSWQPVEVNGLTAVSSLFAGGNHSCALDTTGGIKCWGDNQYGQLGNIDAGSFSSLPVDVLDLASGIETLSAGGGHTCALTTTGGVKCWGYNFYGQLGDGSTQHESAIPVDVLDLASGVKAVSAGGRHTCALTIAGGVKCWGANDDGQLGDGTTIMRSTTPVQVFDLTSGVQAIAAGANHTCVLTTSGGVKCWGDNQGGQLGGATSSVRSAKPVDVLGLASGVQEISALGGHTCVLSTGGAKCWGYAAYGQLGDGTAPARQPMPVYVSGLNGGVQDIVVGGYHTCALLVNSGVKCWGGNDYGQLGVNPGWTPIDVVASALPLLDDTLLESQMSYPRVAAGAALSLWVNVRNTGTATWEAGYGYGWGGTDQWQGQYDSIPGAVMPGQVFTFAKDIIAPAQPGTYRYGFVLQHNGVKFGPYFFVEVTVHAPPAPTVLVRDESGNPIDGAQVFRNGVLVGVSQSNGVLVIPDLIAGDKLAARRLITENAKAKNGHNQGSGQNWSYRVYTTSIEVPKDQDLTQLTVTDPGIQQVLTIKKGNTLIGFNIIASVEWDASAEYLRELRRGFQFASEYLYDASDGQMVFEQVTIFDDNQHMGDADYQIRAE